MKFNLVILASFSLVGCANTPNDFSTEHHNASKSIQLVKKGETPDFKFIQIQKVSSNSCDSETAARVFGDENEALLVLKLETVKVGGDAIVNYSCWTSPLDLINNCWVAKKCEGNAVYKISN